MILCPNALSGRIEARLVRDFAADPLAEDLHLDRPAGGRLRGLPTQEVAFVELLGWRYDGGGGGRIRLPSRFSQPMKAPPSRHGSLPFPASKVSSGPRPSSKSLPSPPER
jgi:hypothetical protein